MRLTFLLRAICVIATGPPAMLTAQSSACRGPNAISNNHKTVIVRIVTDTGPKAAAVRTVRDVPQVSSTDVELVTDSATCAAALAAHQTRNPAASGPVYLFRIGTTRYVLYAQEALVGEWRPVHVYDAAFNYRRSWAM